MGYLGLTLSFISLFPHQLILGLSLLTFPSTFLQFSLVAYRRHYICYSENVLFLSLIQRKTFHSQLFASQLSYLVFLIRRQWKRIIRLAMQTVFKCHQGNYFLFSLISMIFISGRAQVLFNPGAFIHDKRFPYNSVIGHS